MPARTDRTPHRSNQNACFGCGEANPDGMRLKFRAVADAAPGTVEGRLRIPKRFTGAPRMLHGGIVATILDEAMSKVNAHLGVTAVTTRLDVSYRRPVPPTVPITVRGRRSAKRGRHVYNVAEILDQDGQLLATGRGRFYLLPREVVQRMGVR